jgi:hypothetical protein
LSETLQLSIAERKRDSDQFETEKFFNYCTLEERDKLYSQTIYFSNGTGKKWRTLALRYISPRKYFLFLLNFGSGQLTYVIKLDFPKVNNRRSPFLQDATMTGLVGS